LNENGWFVLEHTPRNDYKTFPYFKMEKNYGTTIFSIFVNRDNI
jgi:16S rRNA (guanine966-N2)-methyltransferase